MTQRPKSHSKCAVPGCFERPGESLSYHKLPKSMELRQAWVKAANLDPSKVVGVQKICSKHFPPEAYQRDLKSELMGTKRIVSLIPGVVPSIFSRSQKRGSERGQDHNRIPTKRTREEIMNTLSPSTHFVFDSLDCNSIPSSQAAARTSAMTVGNGTSNLAKNVKDQKKDKLLKIINNLVGQKVKSLEEQGQDQVLLS